MHEHPLKERVCAKANHYVTGRDGRRDIDLLKFALEGMQLHGRLLDVRGTSLHFGDDLAKNLDHAATGAESIKNTIGKYITDGAALHARLGTPDDTRELNYARAGITSIIWSMGYRTDYSWIEIPVFNGQSYPSHERTAARASAEPGPATLNKLALCS